MYCNWNGQWCYLVTQSSIWQVLQRPGGNKCLHQNTERNLRDMIMSMIANILIKRQNKKNYLLLSIGVRIVDKTLPALMEK